MLQISWVKELISVVCDFIGAVLGPEFVEVVHDSLIASGSAGIVNVVSTSISGRTSAAGDGGITEARLDSEVFSLGVCEVGVIGVSGVS